MKTYEVTVKVNGIKRVFTTYTIHATTKQVAERVAETEFNQEYPEKCNLGINWKFIAKAL